LSGNEQTQIHAKVGQPVTISHDVNPSTGYVWHPLYNAAEATLLDRGFAATPGAMGAASIEHFVFTPHKIGSVELAFDLRRPWEQNARERRKYRLTVTTD
jgi:predicted secreted protein